MESSYKIYCYLFENNNKIIIPDNYIININNISEDGTPLFYPNVYRSGYECINYLMSFNIEKYNDKSSYLMNAYKKNNIKYSDNISSDICNNDFILDILLKRNDMLDRFEDGYEIIRNVSIEEDNYIYNIGKGNNKLFTLNDLICSLLKKSLLLKNITIITVIKDIKYLHRRSIYNHMMSPLNRYIMSKHNILFDILRKKNVNTVSTAYDFSDRENHIIIKNKINNLETLNETNHNILIDILNIKELEAYIDTIYKLNMLDGIMRESVSNGRQIFENFIEDYKIKENMIINFNELFNKFLINGFDILPPILRGIYEVPFDNFFRNTEDASKILNRLDSYNMIKNTIKICYEEDNMKYNYEYIF